MPYTRSLSAYVLPEFEREAPRSWVKRLREISPVTDTTSHLRFRWREPKDFWLHPERGLWELYSCTPRHLVERDRALSFADHWSELPTEFQEGRKSVVSNYQHFMWHSQGVEVRRFWVLQGEWGGTPALYSPREKRLLDAVDAYSEPFPLGAFPPIPFDERCVKFIVERDRLRQADHDLTKLAGMERPDFKKAEDDAAERVYRERLLKHMHEMTCAQAEFLTSYLRKSESDQTMERAPDGLSDGVATFRDQYIEHGSIPQVGARAQSRNVSVAVSALIT